MCVHAYTHSKSKGVSMHTYIHTHSNSKSVTVCVYTYIHKQSYTLTVCVYVCIHTLAPLLLLLNVVDVVLRSSYDYTSA